MVAFASVEWLFQQWPVQLAALWAYVAFGLAVMVAVGYGLDKAGAPGWVSWPLALLAGPAYVVTLSAAFVLVGT